MSNTLRLAAQLRATALHNLGRDADTHRSTITGEPIMADTSYNQTIGKPTLKIKVANWRYWHIKRPIGKLGWFFLKRTPKRLLYWMVVQAAVKVEPNLNPGEISANEILKRLGDR